jgi:hypothetical protein
MSRFKGVGIGQDSRAGVNCALSIRRGWETLRDRGPN